MATEASIEAARTRIQRLVEEIAALSKADLASEEFFNRYLKRVVAATDGKGGAIWLVGSAKGEFQLCTEVNFETSAFQSDEAQRAAILKLLTQVIDEKRPLVLPPENPAATEPAAASPNRTPYPFLHVPLFLKGKPLGVLQVWLMPYVTRENYGEFATFLMSLAAYVEQHLQSRQLGNLVLEIQRLQHLLRFSGDLAGSLDALEVARLTANYGRDLAGCDRCSLLLHDTDRWSVMAISGQEMVEKKSALVKAMAAFVGVHCEAGSRILSKKELLANAEATPSPALPEGGGAPAADLSPSVKKTDEVDLAYFELSHVVSAVVCPILDSEKRIVGALFFESSVENFFGAPTKAGSAALPGPHALTDWIATHSGRALLAARDYQTLPLVRPLRKLRDLKLALTGPRQTRRLFKGVCVVAAVAAVAMWPKKWEVNGNCTLIPTRHAQVVAEIPGRLQKILIREGERVNEGQVLAQLDTRMLETELEITRQQKAVHETEAGRYRAGGDEALAQGAHSQARIAELKMEQLKTEIANSSLRAPFDGTILTKDIELHAGEVLQAGSAFAEVAALDKWELQMEVSEQDIGMVENALKDRGAIGVSFILYTQTASVVPTKLSSRKQISAAAYPKEKESVFYVSIEDPEIPADMQKNLRPGLTGRARIEVGRQPFGAVLSRKIVRWFQMRFL
jgi:HlyD family secretion protein